jgi:hypothetical protein
MDRIIGICGLTCTECLAFIATQADDLAALERVAAQWREEYQAPSITADGIMCDGCLTTDGRKCHHCFECEIRACGIERGVVNCAHCGDYACERLEAFFGFVPDARTTLDGVRTGLTV